MDDSLDETTLDHATLTALAAEVCYSRTARKPVFVIPDAEQVKRLIAAAWPVLDEARKAGDPP